MLRSDLKDALGIAMKGKDPRSVSTIRLILAALKDRDIAARSKSNMDGISEAEILTLLQAMIKQRRESAELYEKGGRPELAQQEIEEIGVIHRFMPAQMDEDEMRAAIAQAVTDLGATSLKDMGRIMAALRERHAGRMDFAKVGALVKAQFG